MPKEIRDDLREMVLNVKEFFLKEKQSNAPIIPFKKVNERVAAATGISLRTVVRIANEGRPSTKIVTPGKSRKIRKDAILMADSEIEVLRRIIHELYAKKETPSVNKLHCLLKEEIGFKGSREVLRQHVKKLGYQFRNIKSKTDVPIETNDITAPVLQAVKQEPVEIPVVYFAETCMPTGQNADETGTGRDT